MIHESCDEAISREASGLKISEEGAMLAEEAIARERAVQQRAHELALRAEELRVVSDTLAHDLRSPFAKIVMAAQMLKSTAPWSSPEQRDRTVETIIRSARKAEGLIADLYLLCDIAEARVRPRPLEMGLIVEEALARNESLIAERGARIELPERWPAAKGYAPWVETVWVNYINNAVKYGGCPPVVQLDGCPQSGGLVRFWVRDNGKGIEPEHHGRVFERLARLEPEVAEGHGLGLSIVRRIVERLGGGVGLESTPGQGSFFYFTLPA